MNLELMPEGIISSEEVHVQVKLQFILPSRNYLNINPFVPSIHFVDLVVFSGVRKGHSS